MLYEVITTVSVQIHRQRQLLAAGEDGAAVIAHRPADQQPIAGPDAMHAQIPARRYPPRAAGIDEQAIGRAPRHHLGVAGDNQHSRLPAGRSHGATEALQLCQRQAFLDDEPAAQVVGPGTTDRQIVEGTAHRQPADVAAGEFQRRDHEGVGGERQPLAGRKFKRQPGLRITSYNVCYTKLLRGTAFFMPTQIFTDYPAADGHYDELLDAKGQIRQHWHDFADELKDIV